MSNITEEKLNLFLDNTALPKIQADQAVYLDISLFLNYFSKKLYIQLNPWIQGKVPVYRFIQMNGIRQILNYCPHTIEGLQCILMPFYIYFFLVYFSKDNTSVILKSGKDTAMEVSSMFLLNVDGIILT